MQKLDKEQHVSVIIPTFNRSKMVSEAVSSVLEQTRPASEIIVIDDGSTDDTARTLAAFGDAIRLFSFPNSGISAARNRGIDRARYGLIAFLDSDDLWLKDKLACQLAFMKSNTETMICYTDEIWLKSNVRVNQGDRHKKPDGWIFEPSLHLCLVSPSSVLIRKKVFETIGLFDEELPVCEDYDFWLRAAHRFPFKFIDRSLIIKRGGHPDQLSHTYWGMDRFRIQVLQKLLAQPDLSPVQRRQVLQVILEKSSIIAHGCHIRNKTAEEHYFQAIEQTARKELSQL
ncbi:glycosyltransferase [bacterium]|nr:glycosyltransferase [bacterium]